LETIIYLVLFIYLLQVSLDSLEKAVTPWCIQFF